MAEVEIAGAKIKGGKLLLLLPILGTLAGGLWGGVEFYKDYMNMREKIESYTAPDLSGFDKRLSVLSKKMDNVVDSVTQARDYTRDIKNDLKADINTIETQVDDVERRGKDSFKLVRESIETNDKKVRKMVTDSSDRFDRRREQLRNDMDNLEKRIKAEMKETTESINNRIRKALENPLANMRKNKK